MARRGCRAAVWGFVLGLSALAVVNGPLARAQPPALGPADVAKWKSIKWQYGPTVGKISNLAEVKVPKGFKFSDRDGLLKLLDLTKNSTSPSDLAVLCPQDYDIPANNDPWFLTFEWNNIGFVKDEDKNNLNGDAIMANMKQNQDADNRQRTNLGFPTLMMLGWAKAPFYDPETNLLTWATRISETARPNAITVNYNSRILGREGVMSANLVIGEQGLDQTLPVYRDIVKGFSYVPGKKYSEWRSGDKVATMGLTALIAGGAAAAAAKGGLIGKLGKGIVYIVVAVVAGIGSLFKKLFGSKEDAQS